jgi:transposase
VLAGQAAGEPKSGDGRAQMIRTFRSARQWAVKARSQAANQLQSFLVTKESSLPRPPASAPAMIPKT